MACELFDEVCVSLVAVRVTALQNNEFEILAEFPLNSMI
jgi:hypothetical protein